MGSAMPTVVLEDSSCPLGCRRSDEVLFVGRDRLHQLPGEFSVVRCRVCGHMRTNPRPTPSTIGLYYPDDYGPYLDTVVVEEDSEERPRGILHRLAAHWIDSNARALPSLAPGRLLEIGCASGSFLARMARVGWSVEGIEFSASASAAARALGLSVQTGPLETAAPPASKLDMVVGWMVLEHLHEPLVALRRLREWTRPGGWLVLSLPDAGSPEARFFGASWYDLHLPAHLQHFTLGSLQAMLKMAGWKTARIIRQSDVSAAVMSCSYLADGSGLQRVASVASQLTHFPHSAQLLAPLSWVASRFGLTGRITVWARN